MCLKLAEDVKENRIPGDTGRWRVASLGCAATGVRKFSGMFAKHTRKP
jgi:hypothetical protein